MLRAAPVTAAHAGGIQNAGEGLAGTVEKRECSVSLPQGPTFHPNIEGAFVALTTIFALGATNKNRAARQAAEDFMRQVTETCQPQKTHFHEFIEQSPALGNAPERDAGSKPKQRKSKPKVSASAVASDSGRQRVKASPSARAETSAGASDSATKSPAASTKKRSVSKPRRSSTAVLFSGAQALPLSLVRDVMYAFHFATREECRDVSAEQFLQDRFGDAPPANADVEEWSEVVKRMQQANLLSDGDKYTVTPNWDLRCEHPKGRIPHSVVLRIISALKEATRREMAVGLADFGNLLSDSEHLNCSPGQIARAFDLEGLQVMLSSLPTIFTVEGEHPNTTVRFTPKWSSGHDASRRATPTHARRHSGHTHSPAAAASSSGAAAASPRHHQAKPRHHRTPRPTDEAASTPSANPPHSLTCSVTGRLALDPVRLTSTRGGPVVTVGLQALKNLTNSAKGGEVMVSRIPVRVADVHAGRYVVDRQAAADAQQWLHEHPQYERL